MDAYKSLLELRCDRRVSGRPCFFFPSLFFSHHCCAQVLSVCRNKAAAAAKAEAAKGFVTDPGAAKLAVQDPAKPGTSSHSPNVSRSNSESRAGLTESSFRDRLGEWVTSCFVFPPRSRRLGQQDRPRFGRTRLC